MTELSAYETDVARLISGHYEEVEMNATYRVALFERTAAIVSSRSRRVLARWLPHLAAAAILAVIAALWLAAGRPEAPGTRQTSPPPRSSRDLTAALPAASAADAAEVSPGEVAARDVPAVGPETVSALEVVGAFVAVIGARGSVTDYAGRTLAVGDKLPVGTAVRTGPDARVTLITRRGSEFTLAAKSALRLDEPDTASLDAGQLYCRSRGGEIARIDTAPGQIHLLGTTLDASVEDKDTVAVTVLEGKVRLTNSRGQADVTAGRRALLIASRPPETGQSVNPFTAAAWYYGRGDIVSDFGDIAYVVTREQAQGLASEVWAMNADGSDKRRLKSYLGWGRPPGPWLPGQQWLVFNAHSVLWTTPDFEGRRAHTGAGHPILDDQAWLISAPTGQDIAFDLPPGTDPLYSDLSPDGTRLAFTGSYQPDPDGRESREGGLWVFDMTTGEMKKLLDGYIKTPLSWAPDGRHIVADTAEGYVVHHPLVVVDADTGEVRDLGVDGAGGIFSPDGRKIAYVGEFQAGGSWSMGVPVSGRIMVYDLDAGRAVPISPSGEGALQPCWSPDGRWIAYRVTLSDERDPETGRRKQTQALLVAAADGSTTRTALESDEPLVGYAWMPSGDAFYLVTGDGLRIIAADGSGTLADLGGNAQDSVLSAERASQTEAALDAVREAVFQYAVGNVRRFEGRPAEATAAFQAAADTFAGISWQYPLAQFSHSQLLLYSDTAAREADRPRDEILSQGCDERIRYYLETLLTQYVGHKGEFPPDLAALEVHSLESSWTINWISNKDTEWVKMMFGCPVCGPFTYSAPAGEPDFGDALVSCRCHPDHKLVWTMELGRRVSWSQEAAVRKAEAGNEKLKQLLEEAEDTRHRASMGGLTWRDAERSYLAVLEESPQNPTAREYLGRIYARRGEFRKALDVLPTYRAGWSALHRAFCYDALGKRDKAVSLYQSIADTMPGSTPALWAERGLKEPTWMHDIDIPAEPGEVRIRSTEEWSVSATLGERAKPSRPEFAIDGSRATAWTTGGQKHGQEPGEHFQLDFGRPQLVSRIVLDHHGEASIYPTGWPRGVKASATDDGTSWHPVEVAQGGIMTPVTVRFSPPRQIRGVRFETTATHDPEWWGVFEVFIFAPEQ